MNREDVIKYSLSLPNTYEDYPFPDDNISITMKHSELSYEQRTLEHNYYR